MSLYEALKPKNQEKTIFREVRLLISEQTIHFFYNEKQVQVKNIKIFLKSNGKQNKNKKIK